MKTEEEIKKEIAELKERIEVRNKEIIQADNDNEHDEVSINTLEWALITTPKKKKHNPSNEADDFDTETEINQYI